MLREEIAKVECELSGYDPNVLEPGDAAGIDGYLPNGDPAHWRYKDFFYRADKLIPIINAYYSKQPSGLESVLAAKEAEIDRLRKALESFISHTEGYNLDGTIRKAWQQGMCSVNYDSVISIAKQALKGE